MQIYIYISIIIRIKRYVDIHATKHTHAYIQAIRQHMRANQHTYKCKHKMTHNHIYKQTYMQTTQPHKHIVNQTHIHKHIHARCQTQTNQYANGHRRATTEINIHTKPCQQTFTNK